MNVNDVIDAYLKLREFKESVVQKHKDELAPINEQMNKCLLYVQQQLQSQGLQNFKGLSGIAFLQTDESYKVQDWEPFYQWVRDNNAPMFLERRACKSVCQEYMAANDALPPGLSVSTSVAAHIRKS